MAERHARHERLAGHGDSGPESGRRFGVTLGVLLAVVAVLPALHGGTVRLWAVVAAAGFIGVAVAVPAVLAPLDRIWLRSGRLLGRLATGAGLALLFWLAVTPAAILRRRLGRPPLRLDLEPGARSYWVPREPPDPVPETQRRQS